MAQKRRGKRRVVIDLPLPLYDRTRAVVESHTSRHGLATITAYVIAAVASKVEADEDAWRREWERAKTLPVVAPKEVK